MASGGELARIALAFKSIFSNHSLKTLVFDEIDVGISGDIALKVAEKIQALSTSNQVFCITHLPQTASIGRHHYHLEKEEVPSPYCCDYVRQGNFRYSSRYSARTNASFWCNL